MVVSNGDMKDQTQTTSSKLKMLQEIGKVSNHNVTTSQSNDSSTNRNNTGADAEPVDDSNGDGGSPPMCVIESCNSVNAVPCENRKETIADVFQKLADDALIGQTINVGNDMSDILLQSNSNGTAKPEAVVAPMTVNRDNCNGNKSSYILDESDPLRVEQQSECDEQPGVADTVSDSDQGDYEEGELDDEEEDIEEQVTDEYDEEEEHENIEGEAGDSSEDERGGVSSSNKKGGSVGGNNSSIMIVDSDDEDEDCDDECDDEEHLEDEEVEGCEDEEERLDDEEHYTGSASQRTAYLPDIATDTQSNGEAEAVNNERSQAHVSDRVLPRDGDYINSIARDHSSFMKKVQFENKLSSAKELNKCESKVNLDDDDWTEEHGWKELQRWNEENDKTANVSFSSNNANDSNSNKISDIRLPCKSSEANKYNYDASSQFVNSSLLVATLNTSKGYFEIGNCIPSDPQLCTYTMSVTVVFTKGLYKVSLYINSLFSFDNI